MRGRRRFRHMVVASQSKHAAMFGSAGIVGVLEGVARAVDARPLPVPDAEHAVIAGIAEGARLLRAPNGGRRQVLVHARLEADVVLVEEALCGPQLLVVAAERRTAIARHEA